MDPAIEILVNAGLVVGLVEALKRALGPALDVERFGPLLALAVGLVTAQAGVALEWYDATHGEAVLIGIIAGVSAAGLYRSGRMARGSEGR